MILHIGPFGRPHVGLSMTRRMEMEERPDKTLL